MSARRKRTDILAALADIEHRLPLVKADSIAAAAIADDVRRWIDGDLAMDTDGGHREDYHKAGVRLWNLVLRLERELPLAAAAAAMAEYRRLLVCCRVLALLVLESALGESSSSSSPERASYAVYLLEVSVRAARACLQLTDGKDATSSSSSDQKKLGRLALDHAAKYQRMLDDDGRPAGGGRGDQDDDPETAQRRAVVQLLNTKRTILELRQLWTETRHADADRLFLVHLQNIHLSKTGIDFYTREELSVTLLNMGVSHLAKKDYTSAVTWLDRALASCSRPREVTNGKGVADERKESANLRQTVMHALASAALGLDTPGGYTRAKTLTEELVALPDGAENRRIQLLQLELYASKQAASFDADSYAAVLLKMIRSFSGTSQEEFLLVHHHIQILHGKSPGLGCNVLDEWMLALRNQDGTWTSAHNEWMEKLVITRVWLLVHQRETQEEVDTAHAVLSKLRMPISADAAAAAQTLMWKRIEQGYQEKQYATATRWCRLALSHIFEAGGRTNRPLIERKLILCADESGDLEGAKAAYASMSEATRDEPMTKYLVYKLAIKLGDLDLAAECLRCIGMSTEKKELLHACVLHARHARQPQFVVQALKKLADSINRGYSYDFGKDSPEHSPVHTPALFRCTILMLRDIIDDASGGDNKDDNSGADKCTSHIEQAIRDLSDVFQGVIDAVELDRDCPAPAKDRLFTTDEIEWFCRAAYNIGLKHAGTWDLRHTVAIMDACVKISSYWSSDGQGSHASAAKKIAVKRLTSRFIIASALSALTRAAAASPSCPGDALHEQLIKDCQTMREHILAFHAELRLLRSSKESEWASAENYSTRLCVLYAFDFEGAIRLGDWDELEMICERIAAYDNPDTLRVVGDMLLRAQAAVPSKKFVSTMRLIVNQLHRMSGFSNSMLLKYYRCLFQAALYRDNDAAFQVLEEVGQLLGAVRPGSPDLGDSQVSMNKNENEDEDGDDAWRDELQYMAAIAFNEGVDWFAGGREDRSRQWAVAATRLAELCGDGGKLKNIMTSHFALLGLGDLGVYPSVETSGHSEMDVSVGDLEKTSE